MVRTFSDRSLFHLPDIGFRHIYEMYLGYIVIFPPAGQSERICTAADSAVHIQHIVCESDTGADLGIDSKSIQCCSIHDDLVFRLRHMPFDEIYIAPFRIVVVHETYLRRYFRKAAICDDSGGYTPAGFFDLRAAFYHRSLFAVHILECSMRIPSDLTERI